MLEVLGVDYLFQHIINTYRREQERRAYQIYVTDTLQLISENVANMASGGKYVSMRWYDMIHPKPVETRTAAEIIERIRGKLQENI